MYKLLLIRRYLLKRRIAWVSLIAVTLCTAMVLIVISVMGGWLNMFRNSFHAMSGDVQVVGNSLTGFPYYREMIDKIDALPGVKASIPVLQTYGLININNQIRQGVEVVAFPIGQVGKVNDFAKSLYLQYELPHKKHPNKPVQTPNYDLLPSVPYDLLASPKAHPRNRPGMIVSVGVVGIHKNDDGTMYRPDGMYEAPTTLTVVPVSPDDSAIKAEDVSARAYWIVDDSRTRIWQYDYDRVYVPFKVLQKDLKMDAYAGQPARCNEIQIKAKAGQNLVALRNKVNQIVAAIRKEHTISMAFPTTVETWDQAPSTRAFISAVEKEVVLTTLLFGIISIVAIFLVFCIFYMIVVEKTKDIGIIKSVGATGLGVLQVFLGYGLAIGVVGAGLGFSVAFLIVHNINALHAWMGRTMGIKIWDPQTYQFDTIPDKMNPHTVAWILAVAVVSAVLGALVPAIRAARMNPVEALRYE